MAYKSNGFGYNNCKKTKYDCSIDNFKQILYNYENIQSQIEVEIYNIIEAINIFFDGVPEEEAAGEKIDEWLSNCLKKYDTNWSDCKCNKLRNQYEKDDEQIHQLIREALDSMLQAQNIFNKQYELYETIKENCYPTELQDDCGCNHDWDNDCDCNHNWDDDYDCGWDNNCNC